MNIAVLDIVKRCGPFVNLILAKLFRLSNKHNKQTHILTTVGVTLTVLGAVISASTARVGLSVLWFLG